MAVPYTGPLLAKVNSRSPVVAFRAKMTPWIVPPKTRLPAVLIKPPHGGETTLCSHLMAPFFGSMAMALPQLSSGANRGGRPPPPPPPNKTIAVGPSRPPAVGGVL